METGKRYEMYLPATIWNIFFLWAAFASTQISASCTQMQTHTELRCVFPPTPSRSRGSVSTPSDPTSVVLHRGMVTTIPSDVTKLDISNSNVRDIRLATFTGFRSLRHLDLSYNKLSTLKVGPFEGLPELTHLNLSNNFIKHLGLGTFNANPKLQLLDLTKNMLGRLEWGVFERMECLQYLYLAKNNLHSRSLNENVMGPLKGMVLIDFSANDMSAAPSTMLQSMSNLQYLIMRKCSLQSMPQFIQSPSLKNMKHLVIAKNEIKNVDKEAFSAMVNLEILELNENGVESINEGALESLRNLRIFHLNGNRLTTIPSGLFRQNPALEQVDLSRNVLQCLSSNLFWGTRLKILSIQYNSLIHIGEAFDKTVHGLHQLYINHNPWSCTSFKRLVKLMNIHRVEYGRHSFDGRSVVCKKNARQYDYCRD